LLKKGKLLKLVVKSLVYKKQNELIKIGLRQT
jgi:hypothetical protein